MEKTFIISDLAAELQEKSPIDTIRLERIGNLNLIHVDSVYVDCWQKVMEHESNLKYLGLELTQDEYNKVLQEFRKQRQDR
jgi:hypothetical protein